MSDPAERLVALALATFHASALVLALVLAIYLGGELGSFLAGLNTLAGFALFLLLWLTTAYATRSALAGRGWFKRSELDEAFVLRGLRWGAVNGALFLAVLVVAGAVGTALATGNVGALLGLGLLAIATPFALVIGAVVGIFFATVDTALLALARRIADRCVESG